MHAASGGKEGIATDLQDAHDAAWPGSSRGEAHAAGGSKEVAPANLEGMAAGARTVGVGDDLQRPCVPLQRVLINVVVEGRGGGEGGSSSSSSSGSGDERQAPEAAPLWMAGALTRLGSPTRVRSAS